MIKIRLEKAWGRDGYNLWLIEYNQQKGYVAKEIKLEMVQMEEFAMLPEPTLFIPYDQSKEYLEAFKSAMVTGGVFSTEDIKPELLAKEEHIKDLRKILDWSLNK